MFVVEDTIKSTIAVVLNHPGGVRVNVALCDQF